ncbi:MAG: hypothetical protein O2865_04095 [Planctomycetota bacterium]|nr:hypothetical protein [Planctomycetota bacterium]MDA0932291.1 hypothetical protein [Planctomycetota bacterium]
MRRTLLSLSAKFCIALTLAAPAAGQRELHPDELALKPKIDAAIDRGVEYLISQQHRDGSWGLHGDYIGGRSSLALYALLQCGVSRDHPAVQRAIAHVDAVEPVHTYATACMILALDALRDGREKRIEALVEKLLGWQTSQGDWGYPHGNPDLSCTQYAALGLWVAHKRGLRVPKTAFLELLERVEDYRGPAEEIDNPELREGETGATRVEAAGYQYRPHGNQKTTGSMTSAGLTVLAICKAGLGTRIPRGLRHQIETQTDAAVRWLAHHFSPDKNPNGGHHLYYVYGLERVGALLQTERFGPHWWYIEGAKKLVQSQKKEGQWGDVTDTCFALLFLRRATGGGEPTTGGGSSQQHLFAAGDANAPVRLRGAGQRPLALWIDGFGDGLLREHERHGLRVVSVDYVDDRGNVLGKLAGDPSRVWRAETYLHSDKAIARGDHKIRARVSVVASHVEPVAEASGGDPSDVRVVESDWMNVGIRDVLAPWMENTASSFRDNLLRKVEPEVEATSERDAQHPARHLFDGTDSKSWLASPDDEAPTVVLRWRPAVRVEHVVVMPAAAHESALRNFDKIEGVEIRFNGDGDDWRRIPIGDDPIAPLELTLDKSRRVSAVEVRFYGRQKVKGQIGLSELILLPSAPSRER